MRERGREREGGEGWGIVFLFARSSQVARLQRGIVHRDIKPSNMLLGKDGYLRLCDYGLSKRLPAGQKTKTCVGTLAYIPPEQIHGDAYDHSADLWSLGISTYELYYGFTPFEPMDKTDETEWKASTTRNIRTANVRFPHSEVELLLLLYQHYTS